MFVSLLSVGVCLCSRIRQYYNQLINDTHYKNIPLILNCRSIVCHERNSLKYESKHILIKTG